MAKKHRILLPVLALLLIGACSRNEEIEQPTSPSGGVEVAILCDNTKEPQVYSLPDGTRTWIDDNDWASTAGTKMTRSPSGRPPTAATIRSTPRISRWPTSPPAIRPPFSIRRSPICRQEPIPTRPSARCRKRQRHAGILPDPGRTDGPLRREMGYSGRRSIDRRRASPVRTVQPNARNSTVARAALPSQMPRTANRSPRRPQHLGRTDHTSGYRFPDRSRRNRFVRRCRSVGPNVPDRRLEEHHARSEYPADGRSRKLCLGLHQPHDGKRRHLFYGLYSKRIPFPHALRPDRPRNGGSTSPPLP